MFVNTTELAVHPPMNKGAIDRVGLADGLFGCAFLGEPQPGADRVVGLSRQPGLECRRIGKRQQWELIAHHFPKLKHQATVGTFRRPNHQATLDRRKPIAAYAARSLIMNFAGRAG
jgi:hypothetical protein